MNNFLSMELEEGEYIEDEDGGHNNDESQSLPKILILNNDRNYDNYDQVNMEIVSSDDADAPDHSPNDNLLCGNTNGADDADDAEHLRKVLLSQLKRKNESPRLISSTSIRTAESPRLVCSSARTAILESSPDYHNPKHSLEEEMRVHTIKCTLSNRSVRSESDMHRRVDLTERKNQLNEGQKNEERRNPKRNRTGKELEQTSNSSKSSSSSCSRQINVDADTELESEFHSDKITRLTNRLHILQNEYDLNFDQFGEILKSLTEKKQILQRLNREMAEINNELVDTFNHCADSDSHVKQLKSIDESCVSIPIPDSMRNEKTPEAKIDPPSKISQRKIRSVRKSSKIVAKHGNQSAVKSSNVQSFSRSRSRDKKEEKENSIPSTPNPHRTPNKPSFSHQSLNDNEDKELEKLRELATQSRKRKVDDTKNNSQTPISTTKEHQKISGRSGDKSICKSADENLAQSEKIKNNGTRRIPKDKEKRQRLSSENDSTDSAIKTRVGTSKESECRSTDVAHEAGIEIDNEASATELLRDKLKDPWEGIGISVLLNFKSFKFCPNFPLDIIKHPSISNRLDVYTPLCPFQVRGRCADTKCPWQHESDYMMADLDIITEVLEYYPQICPRGTQPHEYAKSLLKESSLEAAFSKLLSKVPQQNRIIRFDITENMRKSREVPKDEQIEYKLVNSL